VSISAVSGGPPPFQPNPQDAAFGSAIQQLTSAISSGDLATAQKAYSTLTTLQQSSGQTSGPGGSDNPFNQLLTKIGGDLAAGNISGAQGDLESFKKTAAGHHHHHHGGGAGAGQTPPASTAAATTSTSSTNSVDITA